MYPTSLNFVQYKGKYLGTPKTVFAFVKPSHAKYVKQYLNYENFIIKQNGNVYCIKAPSLKKPINKKQLTITSTDTQVGQYFTFVNNIDICLIDDVQNINNQLELHTHFKLDFNDDDSIKQYHLETIYNKEKDEEIDYTEEFNSYIIMNLMMYDDLGEMEI